MIPFSFTNWNNQACTIVEGESGCAETQELVFQNLTIRKIKYSSNYKADHWCKKGHVAYCIEGSFVLELKDKGEFFIEKGMSFQVSDDESEHRLYSKDGAEVFILDGEFLSNL